MSAARSAESSNQSNAYTEIGWPAALTRAGDGQEAKAATGHLPVVVDTLDKRDEVLNARSEVLDALPKLLEKGVDVSVRAQSIVDGQVNLRLALQDLCLCSDGLGR